MAVTPHTHTLSPMKKKIEMQDIGGHEFESPTRNLNINNI